MSEWTPNRLKSTVVLHIVQPGMIAVAEQIKAILFAHQPRCFRMVRYGRTAHDVNWTSGETPREPFRADVKIRYSAKEVEALVSPLDGKQVSVKFDAPVRDVTAGQAAVFYQGEVLLGGGIIT